MTSLGKEFISKVEDKISTTFCLGVWYVETVLLNKK